MQAVIEWFHSLLVEPSIIQTIIALCLCCGLGLLLGKLHIGRISLGITFVFFSGILFSHLGLLCDQQLLIFSQNAGLVLFVYALGLEVGPSFFPSLKKEGIVYNLFSLLLIALTLGLIVVLHYTLNISMPNLLGIMSGAVTNTPVLAAVQSTMEGNNIGDAKALADIASACAVTYPLGVVGVILALMIINQLKPMRKVKVEESAHKPYVAEFEVLEKNLDGKTIHDLVLMTETHFIISRIWRNEKLIMPFTDTVVHFGDHILVMVNEEDLSEMDGLFGKRDVDHDWNRPDIDWNAIDVDLQSKRVVITNNEVNGKKLGDLKLRNRYGINITRIDRAGIEILASSDLRLQLGDRLVMVGESGALSQATKRLGDSVKMLDKPQLISFFFGMLFGCIVGMIPFFIPGMSLPIKLGIAGGPIVVGILMGAFGPRFKIVTYMANSTTQTLKQLGLAVYLAALGLASGEHFFETIFQGDGLLWIGVGFFITLVPTLLVGLLCTKVFKMNFGESAGMLCGSMANPMALDYAQNITEAKHCSIAYASVYPVAMFIRIITAQVLLMMFV